MFASKLSLFLAVTLTATNSAVNGQVPDSGAYWAVYNATAGPAEDSCLVTEGDSVDDSCCTSSTDITPHAVLKGEEGFSCFSLGPGLIPFSGCISDGVAGYGENCVTDDAPFMAATAEECGCSFVIEGTGCYKANDIPGQQWFVYLDGSACTDMEPDMEEPAATEAPAAATDAPGSSAATNATWFAGLLATISATYTYTFSV